MIVVISLIDFFLSTKNTGVKKRILKILRKKIFSLFCLLFYFFSTQMMMIKTARI
jgi:hypothetical protein